MSDVAGSPERAQAAFTQDSRTIITADGWRFTFNTVLGDHELFDLNTDRQEQQNLAGHAEHLPRMNQLLQRIKAWQQRVNDDLPLPDHITFG
jgi:FtsZ-binding cell division protein ZapB